MCVCNSMENHHHLFELVGNSSDIKSDLKWVFVAFCPFIVRAELSPIKKERKTEIQHGRSKEARSKNMLKFVLLKKQNKQKNKTKKTFRHGS